MIQNADIQEVPKEVETRMLGFANAVGVGFGEKETDEGMTGEASVVVFVTEKMDLDDLDADEVIPEEVEIGGRTYKTDVVQSGVVEALEQVMDEPDQLTVIPEEPDEADIEAIPDDFDRRKKWRPAPAGVACSHISLQGQGTIGTPPLRHHETGKTVFLTNAHVAALSGTANQGDAVLQPGGNGNTADQIGTLLEFSQITFSQTANNRTDAALVEVAPDHMQTDIFELQEDLRGWAEPVVGRTYKKSGRTTGVTEGRLRARNATFLVGFGSHGVARFVGLDVYTPMTLPGDSGSGVGEERADGFYLGGLHFAGGGGVSLSIPIGAILDEFGRLTPLTSQDLVDPQDLRIVRPHFSGSLAAGATTYRWSGPWAARYSAHFEAIPASAGRMVRLEVDRTYLSSSGAHYYLLKIENLSNQKTRYKVNCAVFR